MEVPPSTVRDFKVCPNSSSTSVKGRQFEVFALDRLLKTHPAWRLKFKNLKLTRGEIDFVFFDLGRPGHWILVETRYSATPRAFIEVFSATKRRQVQRLADQFFGRYQSEFRINSLEVRWVKGDSEGGFDEFEGG